MEPKPQDESGYYVWSPPGKDFVVHIRLYVLDKLLAEIMRGFGAVPKRGAEVGGVLIGSIERGDQTVVHVEDFEPVECGYTRGPSFLLNPAEQEDFADVCQHWQPDAGRANYAVGFFRSHTRDGLALAPEDIEILDRYFPGPSHIALLVKPLITKASPAGFFFREDGVFPDATPLEFPFRRRELTGEEAPAHRPLTDRKRPDRGSRALLPPRSPSDVDREFGEPSQPGHAYATLTPTRSRLKGWMWIPLSFVFLLVGLALGFQAALMMSAKSSAAAIPDLSLALTVSKNDQDLTVKWSREAPAIRAAQKGVLEIQDGGFAKSVDLDAVHLQTGSIVYHNSSNNVQFRLTVYTNPQLTVTETLDWKQ
jgi:hypothetical protein